MLVVIAIGELIEQPRYYDYISRLAPAGQQGTYMGFAFLPLGIGSFLGGPIGKREEPCCITFRPVQPPSDVPVGADGDRVGGRIIVVDL